MNRYFRGVLYALGASLLALSTSGNSAPYKAGTYTCTAQGMKGDVVLQVMVSDKAIQDVQIKSQKETQGVADTALTRIPVDIVAQQSLAVDGVSGATFTSKAILTAAEECLGKAGADIAALKKPSMKVAKVATMPAKQTADVVVIGAGGAGMAAALAAAENGANVIVLEKMPMIGGNTILAGGGYNANDPKRERKQKLTDAQMAMIEKLATVPPKNELHKKLQADVRQQIDKYKKEGDTYLFDSPEFHALQTYDAGDYVANIVLVYELAKIAADGIGYLEKIGLVWKEDTTTYVGALWPRSHEARDYKSGKGFIDVYKKTIEAKKYPVKILTEMKAESFIMEGKKVVGVKATGKDGKAYQFKAKRGVVLASGGFAANVAMRMKYNTQWKTLDKSVNTTNSPGITGDGIVMADKIGANLVDMQYIQLLSTCDPKTGSTAGIVGRTTGMYVNKEGKRFVNELERRDVLVNAVMQQPDGMFYMIANASSDDLDKDRNNKYGENVEDLVASGSVVRADTLEDLAKKLGMQPAVLTETVNKWNEAATTQKDAEFGRPAIAENVALRGGGPFYATARAPAVHHTMGGIQINEKTQVLDKNGKVVPGLWAAGEVTGGIHGSNRVGANAIPDALNFGRIAGTYASKKH